MSSNQNLPFPRGSYATNVASYAGHEFVVDDIDYSTAPHKPRTGHQVTLRVVKNNAGANLLPKRLATYKAGTNRTEVDGYVTITAGAPVVAVDEFLPAAGVPDDAYFYVVVKGPVTLLTDIAAAAGNVIPEGTVLVGLTAASSQSTTAGRVAAQDLTGATAVLGGQINGGFGRALSAKTTNNTNADVLTFMANRWD